MCNCNQKRATYLDENRNAKKGMVKVILKDNNPLVVNGNITGRMYIFKKKNDVNWIDERDIVDITGIKELRVIY